MRGSAGSTLAHSVMLVSLQWVREDLPQRAGALCGAPPPVVSPICNGRSHETFMLLPRQEPLLALQREQPLFMTPYWPYLGYTIVERAKQNLLFFLLSNRTWS